MPADGQPGPAAGDRLPDDPAGDAFEAALEAALGERIRASEEVACEMWCALANVAWRHRDGTEVGYSFRDAGGLIARTRGKGSYLDWYCCGNFGRVTPMIAEALARHGWSGDPDAMPAHFVRR